MTLVDFSVPTVAVIGNEGNGLTEETKQACTMRVTIPMKGRAESLNAAASAAILMWEMMRGKGRRHVMAEYDPRVYWIWLQHALGAGSSKPNRILSAYPSLQSFYEAGRQAWLLEGYFYAERNPRNGNVVRGRSGIAAGVQQKDWAEGSYAGERRIPGAAPADSESSVCPLCKRKSVRIFPVGFRSRLSERERQR